MSKMILATLGVMTLISFDAQAIGLDQARSQGLVCEGGNGLLVPTGSPSAEVQQLIQSVNSQRNQEYSNIQANQGTSLTQVQSIAAQEIMDSVPRGTYIMGPGGTCRQK